MSKPVAFRIPEDTLAKLDEMAKLLGTSRNACVVSMVEQQYQAMQMNPQLQKAFKALKQCAEIMKDAGLVKSSDLVQLSINPEDV